MKKERIILSLVLIILSTSLISAGWWEKITGKATSSENFNISEVTGIKDVYNTQEKFTLTIRGEEDNGNHASVNDGFNMQVYVSTGVPGQPVELGSNARYFNGYWYMDSIGPFPIGRHKLSISLYCYDDKSTCAQKYGVAAQSDKEFWFEVKDNSNVQNNTPEQNTTIICTDSDGGDNYYVKGQLQYGGIMKNDFCWKEDKDSPQSQYYINTLREYSCTLKKPLDSNISSFGGDGSTFYEINYNCPNGCSNGACIIANQTQPINNITNDTNQTGLVYDNYAGVYMESIVKNKIDSIRENLDICDNCSTPNYPTVQIDNGDKSAKFSLYLNNHKVRRFILPVYNHEVKVINNPQQTLIKPLNQFVTNGTNTIEFLVESKGQFFPNYYTTLNPSQETVERYEIVKKSGAHGAGYFIINKDRNVLNPSKIINEIDTISEVESNLAGIQPLKYMIITSPGIQSNSYGEGNYYDGNNLIEINYGGDRYFNESDNQVFNEEFSHEYIHLLQDNFSLWQKYQNGDFLMEGMADGISAKLGYKKCVGAICWDQTIEPGCSYLPNPNIPHTLGRCIFKHLDQKDYLTSDFFMRLFNPANTYNLINCSRSSTGEVAYDISLQNPDCVNELNKLLTYLTEKDMSQFVKEELLANISSDISISSSEGIRNIQNDTPINCPQLGYRQSGNYCSIDKIWITQKSSEQSCENNFECDSNLCVNNQCVSGSLWQKILDWFSKLFGGK